ncbi:MAG: hypothetical protein ACLTSJ_09905 [Alistipes communis]
MLSCRALMRYSTALSIESPELMSFESAATCGDQLHEVGVEVMRTSKRNEKVITRQLR